MYVRINLIIINYSYNWYFVIDKYSNILIYYLNCLCEIKILWFIGG